MAFEITYKNTKGSFSVKLERDVSFEEQMQLIQIGSNVLEMGLTVSPHVAYTQQSSFSRVGVMGTPMVGATPIAYSSLPLKQIVNGGVVQQTKLGERPIDHISLGYYREPQYGVRLKMVEMPAGHKKVAAVKVLKELTSMPMYSCMNIVFGNVRCPIIDVDVAQDIMKEFKKLEVYAVLTRDERPMGAGGLDTRPPDDYHSSKTDGAATQ